ncbi:MAG: alanine racemase, partial [Chthoniobacterales bacterium]
AAIRNAVGTQPGIIAVVKADGYGHGGPAVARTLAPLAEQFGVATLEEARAVRAVVPEHDILILSPSLPEERAAVVAEDFIPVVSGVDEAKAYAGLVTSSPARVHLCVDTGMGRIGVWQDEAMSAAREIGALKPIVVESVSTHLPVADSDAVFTAHELEGWALLREQLRAVLPTAKFHALNSAASLSSPRDAPDRVRPGLALYGLSPLPEFQERLRPVMTLKTHITLVREVGRGRSISYGRDFIASQPMRVATLAMGYADGYPRQTSNRSAQVLVRGQRCPVLGRITMDQFMVDVSALPPDIEAGEEVVLFGRQAGAEISVNEVATWAGTISWDIFTRLGRRVALVHRNV